MAQGTTGEGFAYSMVDLMTSLVVIFILLLVVFLRQTSEQAIAESKQTESAREQVMRRLQEELGTLDTKIQVETDERDPLTLLIIVPEGLLGFQKNQHTIPPAGEDFLKSFAPTLAGVLCAPELSGKVDSLIIEGHTDSLTGTEERNIPLSTQRATEVMLQFRVLLKQTTDDLEPCFLNLASASGRGPRDPILDSQGVEDADKSRRVEFKVRVRSIEQRRLQEQLHAGQSTTP